MIEVQLISFVDFVMANGMARVTRVRRIKQQMADGYEQGLDYWKRLRDAIAEFHRDGDGERFERVVSLALPSRRGNYLDALRGYKRFVRKAEEVRPRSSRVVWRHGDLGIVVNPEVRVKMKGNSYVVKLYFKKPELTQRKVEVALHLMRRALEADGRGEPAILDVRRSKLYFGKRASSDLDALLAGEATAFAEIWHRLPAATAAL